MNGRRTAEWLADRVDDDRFDVAPNAGSAAVAENLRIGRGTPEMVLTLFPELKPHLKRRVGLLSGGQQQMLAVGRALTAGPKAF